MPHERALHAPRQVERMQARVAAQRLRVVRVVEGNAGDVRAAIVAALLERLEDGHLCSSFVFWPGGQHATQGI